MKKKTNVPEPSKIHKDIIPAEIRPESPLKIKAKIKGENENEWIDVDVWRVSPLGFEFSSDLSIMASGLVLDVRVLFKDELYDYQGLIVCDVKKSSGICLYSVKWVSSKNVSNQNERKQRWDCPKKYSPHFHIVDNFQFSYVLYGTIINFSEKGLRVSTSLRNKFVLPGMRSQAKITFPMVGTLDLDIKIEWVDVVEDYLGDSLHFGATITNRNLLWPELAGEYAALFAPKATPKLVKESGLIVKSLFSSVSIDYARTKEDIEEVLKLRQKAYSWLVKCESHYDMADEFDGHSRFLIVRHRGLIIASCRIRFLENDDVLEQGKFVDIPDNFPPNREILEVTRICTDPEYRGGELVFEIMKHALMVGVYAQRKYIVGSTSDKTMGVYKNLGMIDAGMPYSLRDIFKKENIVYTGNCTNRVIMFNIENIIKGKGINPIVWHIMNGPKVLSNCLKSNILE